MNDETESTPQPFVTPWIAKGTMLAARELADVTGSDRKFLRSLVARGYLFARGRDMHDGRGSLLFSEDAALTAAALRSAAIVGVDGGVKMQHLALTMQCWHGRAPAKGEPVSPAAWMLMEHWRDPAAVHGFSLELHVSAHAETGAEYATAALRHGDFGFVGEGVTILPEDHEPVGAVILPLDGLIARVAAALDARRRRTGAH